MNIFWTFRKLLKWILWKVIIICTQKFHVILLAYVSETFREESINSFKLDPAHSFSTSGYSWDAIVRFIDINLNLMVDVKKYQFIESTLRVCISMICKGYVEVNNKFLKSCDANKPTSYIINRYILMIYSQNIRKKLPMKLWEPFPNNVRGILNIGIFPECSMNILQMLHALF